MRFSCLFVLLFLASFTFASATECRYFISFTDKNNSSFSVEDPTSFLSTAAIARRAKQGIPVKESDLPVNRQYISALTSAGLRYICQLKWLNGVIVETSDSTALTQVAMLPFVSDVLLIYSPGVVDKGIRKEVQNWNTTLAEETSSAQKIASLSYGLAYNQVHMISCDFLHDSGFQGAGKTIAILDAGFNRVDSLVAFDSLRASNQVLATWDFVHNEIDVYGDDSHGMSVLSCIASNIPGTLVGTAPHASFYLLETEDVSGESIAEEYYWAAAAEYADSAGADIISSSLSYTTFDDTSQDHTYNDLNGHTTVVAMAANHAASAGMLVIVSAGNEGNNPWNYISTPGDADSALAIGAVDSSGVYAAFSGKGPSSDGDVKPNIAAQGADTYVYFPGDIVGIGSGTSFSTPIIAGAAACLWQAFDSLSNMQIFSAIQRSASQFTFPDSLLGYGIPNFATAFTLLNTHSISLPAEEGIVKLFPMPARDQFTLLYNSSSYSTVEARFINVLGQIVFSTEMSLIRGIQAMDITTRDLNSGIYFLEMISVDKKFTAPFIKY